MVASQKPSRFAMVAQEYLQHAETIWAKADFDTAVRDDVAVGLSYIVRAAFDCLALDKNLQGLEFSMYIDSRTAEWFRMRDFSEWFCLAAASGFNTSRPRMEHDDWRFLAVPSRKTSPGRAKTKKHAAQKPKEAK
jgi:hypothetical protein